MKSSQNARPATIQQATSKTKLKPIFIEIPVDKYFDGANHSKIVLTVAPDSSLSKRGKRLKALLRKGL